jgi:hypothetical protein
VRTRCPARSFRRPWLGSLRSRHPSMSTPRG